MLQEGFLIAKLSLVELMGHLLVVDTALPHGRVRIPGPVQRVHSLHVILPVACGREKLDRILAFLRYADVWFEILVNVGSALRSATSCFVNHLRHLMA